MDYLKSKFNVPEDLERFEEVRRINENNKKEYEEVLNNIHESSFRNIRKATEQSQNVLVDGQILKISIHDIFRFGQEYKNNYNQISDLIQLSYKVASHSNAISLLQKVKNIPEITIQLKAFFEKDKILHGYNKIMELECIRYEILAGHTRASSSSHTSTPRHLSNNFLDLTASNDIVAMIVKKVSENVENYAEKDPVYLVSTLRIIERDETIDLCWKRIQNEKTTKSNLWPTDRPRKLRETFISAIRYMIEDKVNKLFSQYDFSQKHACTEFLEKLRSLCMEGILRVCTSVAQCFPPNYMILTFYAFTYHQITIATIEKIVARFNSTQDNNDCVSIILWEQEYNKENFYGNSKFPAEIQNFFKNNRPVLSQETRTLLQDQYTSSLYTSMVDKMQRMVRVEQKEWFTDPKTRFASLDLYRTEFPSYFKEIISSHMTSALKLKGKLYVKIFEVCLTAAESLIEMYIMKYEEFFTNRYESIPRSQQTQVEEQKLAPYFTEYSISIANNCEAISEYVDEFVNSGLANFGKYYEVGNDDSNGFDIEVFEEKIKGRSASICQRCMNLIQMCCDSIQRSFIIDLSSGFSQLFTKAWRESYTNWGEGFRYALKQFSSSLKFLISSFCPEVYTRLDYSLSFNYLRPFFAQKEKYSNENRKKFSEQICKDADFICGFISQNLSCKETETWSYAIKLCADVFRSEDASLASLDLIHLYEFHSDFTSQHANLILSLRGDVQKEQIKNICSKCEESKTSAASKRGLFSKIPVS